MDLHSKNEHLQIQAVHVLNNLADSSTIACEKLSQPDVISIIARGVAKNPESEKLRTEACEALARIMAAGTSQVSSVLPTVIRAVAVNDGGRKKVTAQIL